MESNQETKASFSTGVQLLFVILGSAGMFLLSRSGIMRSREYVIIQFTYPLLLVLTGCRQACCLSFEKIANYFGVICGSKRCIEAK